MYGEFGGAMVRSPRHVLSLCRATCLSSFIVGLACLQSSAARSTDCSLTPVDWNGRAGEKPHWLEYVAKMKGCRTSNCDIAFFGDSIIDALSLQVALQERYLPGIRLAFYGQGSDKSENLLYRVRQHLNEAKFTDIIVLIGTNDTGTPAETAENIVAIRDVIMKSQPWSNIHILGILPRGIGPSNRHLERNKVVRAFLEPCLRDEFVDVGDSLAGPNGGLLPQFTTDRLHLTTAGYEALLQQILAKIPLLARGAEPK